jgi:hypoxanthine phosphoribosyltransferase
MTLMLNKIHTPAVLAAGNKQYAMTSIVSGEDIRGRVEELSGELADRYADGGEVLALGVMKGAIHFASDLRRGMQRANPDLMVTSDDIRISSYSGMSSSGVVRPGNMPENLEGKHVLLIEDILDTGLTLNWLLKNISSRRPASLEVAVAVRKDNPERDPELLKNTPLYVGFDMPNDFLVGYGLDVDQYGRDLDGIYKLEPSSTSVAPPVSPSISELPLQNVAGVIELQR